MSTKKLTYITFHYISNRISICDTLMLVLQTKTIVPMLVLLPIMFVIDHLNLFQVFVVSPGSSGRPTMYFSEIVLFQSLPKLPSHCDAL